MSFSKAKLKRFNDIEICDSPSAASAVAAHPERKEQIEKFLKENAKFTLPAAPKEKESKSTASKLKGLRLFRTPSLPHRLRFRQNSDVTSSTSSGVPKADVQPSKTASNTPLKGKDALHFEIRSKTELLDNYSAQIDELSKKLGIVQEAEARLCLENSDLKSTIKALHADIDCAHEREAALHEKVAILENEMKILIDTNNRDLSTMQTSLGSALKDASSAKAEIDVLTEKLREFKDSVDSADARNRETLHNLENLRLKNAALEGDLVSLQKQIEDDALNYVEETANAKTMTDKLQAELGAVREELAEKLELIEELNDEILEKNIEIDSVQDVVREQYLEKLRREDLERKLLERDEKIELQEKEMGKMALETRDMQVLLENANELIRERDDKLLKCEEQVQNGLDYYVQLSSTLQTQVTAMKQECSRALTEKYNYQLTLNNTRSTVNILMERLKKSDSDVESLKSELEAVANSKGDLERKYSQAEIELDQLRASLAENEAALAALLNSSQVLQNEVNEREVIFSNLLTSEEDTVEKVNQITSLFQNRMDSKIEKYIEMYADLKRKHESRETYITDMKHALDEFARVIEFAQIELDTKEQGLVKLRQENDNLKLENISLKSKADTVVPEKDLCHKMKSLLRDSELKAECDQWLINANANKNLESPIVLGTPTKKSLLLTPNKPLGTPKTPKTPRSLKKINFAGKENLIPTADIGRSPQNILRPRN